MTIATISGGRDVVSAGADMPVREVVALLARHRIGAVPVLVEGRVAGVFSERDMIHALVEVGAGALDMAVGERMTSPAITVTRDISVLGALSLMTQRRIRHLPVVEGSGWSGSCRSATSSSIASTGSRRRHGRCGTISSRREGPFRKGRKRPARAPSRVFGMSVGVRWPLTDG